MITLNEQQVNELNNNLLEMPTKYGYPLILWFKQIVDEQNPKKEQDFTNNPNDPNANLG